MNTEDGYLLVQLPREELLAHLQARAAHHTERATEAMKRVDTLAAELDADLAKADTVTDRINIKNSSTYNNKNTDLDRARGEFRSRSALARKFTFIGAHLAPGTSAFLSTHELDALELLK